MNVAVTFMITSTITLLVLFSVASELSAMLGAVTDSWTDAEERMERKADTGITGASGQWAGEDPTVRLTLANNGNSSLAQFADWDVIFEIQKVPGLGISYLTYTSTSPGTNEWTVDGIYRDATTLAAETVGPGIFDAGEEMVVLAKPDPPVVLDTYDRATFASPNGVTAKVIFEIVVTPTPTP